MTHDPDPETPIRLQKFTAGLSEYLKYPRGI